jgi:hypothetical protein
MSQIKMITENHGKVASVVMEWFRKNELYLANYSCENYMRSELSGSLKKVVGW